IEKTYMTEKSNGYERQSADSASMKMYKLYPEYNIMFADKGNELFGYERFDKNEIRQTGEYEHLSALKEHGYFNRQSYKNLENKILDYCWAKSEENPNMKITAALCMESFENAKQGLFEYNYNNADGSFHGWMDASQKKNGKGILISNTGYKYVGSFKNDFMEYGTITMFDGTNVVKGQYTGSFKENNYEGNGMQTAFHANGDTLYTFRGKFSKGMRNGQGTLSFNDTIYSGTWKKGEFVEGKGTYDGGIYTGKWKLLKNEKRTVPDGKGVLRKPDGETITGNWKDGILVTKKEKGTN
ncbi:MAG: hypothetical protein LBI60_01585, partial [Bacteroidales bacterium]|nr:hypothetical protein [Bacteroidales bacterium]